MSEEILINVTPRETRVALVENGMLQELHIERASRRGVVGNVYKGRVQRVMPGMQAAFVDLGNTVERKAYLYVADILGAGDERRLLEGYDGGDDDDEEEDDEEEAAEKPKHGRGGGAPRK